MLTPTTCAVIHRRPLAPLALSTAMGFLTMAIPARSAVVVQYSFEGNLNDTAAGGTVADNLTFNRGAAVATSPVYVAGVAGGQAVDFSGNWFQAPDSADADLVGNTWALETFIKVSTHNGQWERLIVKWGSSNDYHFSLETKDFNFFTGNPDGNIFDRNTTPATNFTDGQWHHVACTSSAAGVQAWIDGVSVFTSPTPVTLANGSDPLGIGDFGVAGSNNGLRMHGVLDEIRIHNTAIDQTYVNSRVGMIRGPVISSFIATPANVPANGTTTLSWTVTNANTLTLNGGSFSNQDVTGLTSIVTAPLPADTTFTLTAAGTTSSTSANRLVGVGASVQEPVLNEFLAANDTGIRDAAVDGDRSDWIEIYNPNTLYSLDMGGYHLTDEPDNVDKWTFPAVSIPPQGYLVVYASEKNRVSGQYIHTNFKLSENGEYLALVKPNGTILQQFAPTYPNQTSDVSYSSTGYLATPTPGAVNSALAGPAITAVTENPPPPLDGDNITITATPASQNGATVTGANLIYRVMYGAEVSVPMTAGTGGVYSAVIPASASTPGQMVRWRITATDSAGRTSRAPLYRDPVNSPEYLGTMVQDPAISTMLPIIHRFVNPASASTIDTDPGTRCSIFYQGEFFDNVGIRIRGFTSRSWPKKSHKIEMNSGHRFRFRVGVPRVTEFDLNTTYTDKSYVRAQLNAELDLALGMVCPEIWPIQVRQNAAFYSVALFTENPDTDFLQRHGVDPDGAYYKAPTNNTYSTSSTFEKKTRLYESGKADLDALITNIGLTGTNLETYVFDNVDLPGMVNYIATTCICQNIDASDKNHFVYRDTNNSGEWVMLPWDLDLTFGPNALNTDTIVYNQNYASHPFIGASPYLLSAGKNNRFLEAVINTPRSRDMVIRRIRSLVDKYLATNWFQNRMDQLFPILDPDVTLDHNKWLTTSHYSYSGAAAYTLLQSHERLKTLHLAPRLTYLNSGGSVGIPASQVASPQINFGAYEANPSGGNQDQEYIELQNPNAFSVDVSNWTIEGGVTHTIKSGTVMLANSSLYLTPKSAAFRARITGPRGGQRLFVQGGYNGHLSNFGETLTLKNTAGAAVASLTIPPAPSDPQRFLVISEVMYHPEPDGDAEFIELMNISPAVTLNLAGVKFTAGVEFTFPPGSTLAPLARVLVVKNTAAFEAAYGTGKPVAGQFASLSSLSNGGERVKLDDATGSTIREFDYDDIFPWPVAADGSGSLVLIAPLTNPDHSLPQNWRASMTATGNPNTDDVVHFTGTANGDDNNNGWSNLVEYSLGANPSIASSLTPEGLTFTIPRFPNADDAEIVGEVSTALAGWTAADLVGSTGNSLTFRVPAALTAEKRIFIRASVRLRP